MDFYIIMLFETNILSLLKFLPHQKLLQEKKRMRELLAQKRRLLTPEQVSYQSTSILSHIESLSAFDGNLLQLHYHTY